MPAPAAFRPSSISASPRRAPASWLSCIFPRLACRAFQSARCSTSTPPASTPPPRCRQKTPTSSSPSTADIISRDIRDVMVDALSKPFPPWVVSKFLGLGMPLEQVVTLATAAPAKAIGTVPKLGTLQMGAPADLSLVEIVEGPVDFVDTRQNQRKGQRYIKPIQTVKAGRPFGRPYHRLY